MRFAVTVDATAVRQHVKRGKRTIDVKRESGGSFQLGDPGDIAVDMMAVEGRLLGVTKKAVYGTNFADHIDPDRTDIHLPNIISQKLLDYGAQTPFISETLLTGAELFNETYLGRGFNRNRGLEIAFEAAQNLAAMTDFRLALAYDQGSQTAPQHARREIRRASANAWPTLAGRSVHPPRGSDASGN